MGPAKERSNISLEQYTNAEARVGEVHPVVSLLRTHAPRITELNAERARITENSEVREFVKDNFGFLAEDIEGLGSISVEPLDLVSIWAEVHDRGINYLGYDLASALTLTYAIQGLDNPAWKGVVRRHWESKALHEAAAQDLPGLFYVKHRARAIGNTLDEISLYAHGSRNAIMEAADLGARMRDGDPTAKAELDELLAYDKEHSTELLETVGENFGNGFVFLSMAVQKALMDHEDDPFYRAFEIAADVDPDQAALHRPGQFGNNFFLFFYGLRLAPKVESGEISREDFEGTPSYRRAIKRTKEFGDTWTAFTEQNSNLMREVDSALSDYEVYQGVVAHAKELLKDGKFDEEEAFSKSFHPRIENALETVVWGRINSLMEQAAGAMEAAGINPREFYA